MTFTFHDMSCHVRWIGVHSVLVVYWSGFKWSGVDCKTRILKEGRRKMGVFSVRRSGVRTLSMFVAAVATATAVGVGGRVTPTVGGIRHGGVGGYHQWCYTVVFT